MIIFFVVSIVEAKGISEPLEFEFLRTIKLLMFESVSSESSIFLIASLKVSVILEVIATLFDKLGGSKIIVGATTSALVKFNVVASVMPA